MSRITDIRQGRKRGEVRLFLDGRFAFTLRDEVAAREGLAVGQELSSGQVGELTMADQSLRCYSAALVYLSYRARSEMEMRQRLLRRGFDSRSVDMAIGQLREAGLVDDREFAAFWRDSRQTFRPRSRWLTGMELRRKGVSPDIVEGALSGIDDEAGALQAARARIRSLAGLEYGAFRRRLGGYLRRRGFSYEIVDRTVKRIWQERAAGKEDSTRGVVAPAREKGMETG